MKVVDKSVFVLSVLFVFLGYTQTEAEEATPSSKTTLNKPIEATPRPATKFEQANQTPSVQRKSVVDPGAVSIQPIKVRITSPGNGQTLKIGGTYNICWNHSSVATEEYRASAQTICGGEGPGLSALPALQKCSEGGGGFTKIFENQPAKGCYSWTIPSDYYPYNYYIKVRLDSTQSNKWTGDEINVAILQ